MEEENREAPTETSASFLDDWPHGTVWFEDWIPGERPWGREEILTEVPRALKGHYAVRVGATTKMDGWRYREGDWIRFADRADLAARLPELATVTDFVFPWYDHVVPAALVRRETQRIDGTAYRADCRRRFFQALLITGGLIAASYYVPQARMLALVAVSYFGLFPLVDAAMAWGRRLDLLSVEELNRRLVNFVFFHRWLAKKSSPSLAIGLGILVAVFLGQVWVGLPDSIGAAALMKDRVREEGEWWRLVTSGLMHANALHILFNGMALYNFGKVMTALVSPALLGVVFLTTVVTGSLASLYLGSSGASVGASGGILGCLGFLLMVTWRFRALLPGSLRVGLIQSTIVVSIFGLLGSDFIDNAAHAGGFLGGLALGLVMAPSLTLAPEKTGLFTRVLSGLSLTVLGLGIAKIAAELWKIHALAG